MLPRVERSRHHTHRKPRNVIKRILIACSPKVNRFTPKIDCCSQRSDHSHQHKGIVRWLCNFHRPVSIQSFQRKNQPFCSVRSNKEPNDGNDQLETVSRFWSFDRPFGVASGGQFDLDAKCCRASVVLYVGCACKLSTTCPVCGPLIVLHNCTQVLHLASLKINYTN